MKEDLSKVENQTDLNYEIKHDEDIKIPFEKDLKFCENIESILEIDEGSRKNILNKLYSMVPEWTDLTNGYEIGKLKLGTFLRIYNQIYKFETDEDRKKEAKEIVNHFDFSLRQLSLS
ncbi:MAG: hypothetical protein QG580_339 [Patescibacteria group bacterium]|nr:hypothetical protein [Patescibacteria group bacterium]